jgi:hypothetical protein
MQNLKAERPRAARSGVDRKQPAQADGFGQSLKDDLLFVLRFRACRRRTVNWRWPADEERCAIESHPIIGRFGDMTQLVADVGEQRWIVRDRDRYGWLDPPQYLFFAVEGEAIRVVRDFDGWPRAWGVVPDRRRESAGPSCKRLGPTSLGHS